MLCAQVASGLGRDPVLNAEANQLPASAAVARVARALNIINGDSYPSGAAHDGSLGRAGGPLSRVALYALLQLHVWCRQYHAPALLGFSANRCHFCTVTVTVHVQRTHKTCPGGASAATALRTKTAAHTGAAAGA